MNASRLSLVNYRNYREETIGFSKGVNILCGENAAGKTNLLEAVCLFSQGRSFRGNEEDLIRFGEDFAKVKLDFFAASRDQSCEIRYESKTRRQIILNGVKLDKVSRLLGNFVCVLFTPDELSLIKGAPEGRRRLIDSAIVPLRPNYVKLLSTYNALLSQKRACLKSRRYETLDTWNERLAEVGSKIELQRYSYVEKLKELAKTEQLEFSRGRENLEINYLPSVAFLSGEDLREVYYNKLCASLEREKEQVSCLVGVHRDDVSFLINGSVARTFGSQGQQRTAVLCVKIAQMEIIRSETGDEPVLLLDDVLSELDADRRAFLLSRIGDRQTFISCTDIDDGVKYDNLIRVSGGKVN